MNIGQMLAKLKAEKEYNDLIKVINEVNESKKRVEELRKKLGLKPGESILK